jgi:hypothetical protein
LAGQEEGFDEFAFTAKYEIGKAFEPVAFRKWDPSQASDIAVEDFRTKYAVVGHVPKGGRAAAAAVGDDELSASLDFWTSVTVKSAENRFFKMFSFCRLRGLDHSAREFAEFLGGELAGLKVLADETLHLFLFVLGSRRICSMMSTALMQRTLLENSSGGNSEGKSPFSAWHRGIYGALNAGVSRHNSCSRN